MSTIRKYVQDRDEQVVRNIMDSRLKLEVDHFTKSLIRTNYTKNFIWLGVPIIQYPSDMMVMQELIWKIRPAYIIETGMAFGGTALFYASILGAIGSGRVVSIDTDVSHWEDLKWHHDYHRIDFLLGNSADKNIIRIIRKAYNRPGPVIVCLDSNHTHEHVLAELNLYAPLVTKDSYLVVFDTAIGTQMKEKALDRPWGPGNNPLTAVMEFLGTEEGKGFVVDYEVETRALITAAPNGWLRRVK